MKQERAHVSFLIGSGSNSKQVGNVQIRANCAAVEGFPNGAETNIRSKTSNRAGNGASVHPVPRQRPDSRRTPQRGRSIQPRNVQPVPEDYACSQEADARDNLPCDAKTIVRTCRKWG